MERSTNTNISIRVGYIGAECKEWLLENTTIGASDIDDSIAYKHSDAFFIVNDFDTILASGISRIDESIDENIKEPRKEDDRDAIYLARKAAIQAVGEHWMNLDAKLWDAETRTWL